MFGKLAIILLAVLALLFSKPIYQVVSAPTIEVSNIEELALFFNSEEHRDQYHKDIWEKFSKCAGMFCWSYYTFSPIFPHLLEVEWVMDVNIFHLFEEKLNNSPYKGHSVKRDRIYNVYWIDDYGPFKLNITNSPNEMVPVEQEIRPYVKGSEDPHIINDISWSTSLSEDRYVISPHLVAHRENKSPEITAYRYGNIIVVKDVFDNGSTWTVISGSVALNHLPPGNYEILYISNENDIPNTDGGTSSNWDIVSYTKFTKE
jgi:hypothetical protein